MVHGYLIVVLDWFVDVSARKLAEERVFWSVADRKWVEKSVKIKKEQMERNLFKNCYIFEAVKNRDLISATELMVHMDKIKELQRENNTAFKTASPKAGDTA